MKKILILMLCCIMYVNNAHSKICFLADPNCDIGIGKSNTDKPGGGGSNPTPDNESMCKDKPDFNKWVKLSASCEPYRIKACKDTTGNYFKGCDNEKGYWEIEAIEEDGIYEPVDENCGCAKIQCPSNYKICGNNLVGDGKSCVDGDGNTALRLRRGGSHTKAGNNIF